jgi:hypothetical protein
VTRARIHSAVLATALFAAVFLLGVMVVAFVSMKKRSTDELCRGNLLAIYMTMRTGELFGSPHWDEAGTGRAFLAQRHKWPTRQLRPLDLSCPVKGRSPEIDFRGPASRLRELTPDDPILADRPGNHGPGRGGNVALKSGRIAGVSEDHAFWQRAARTTSD